MTERVKDLFCARQESPGNARFVFRQPLGGGGQGMVGRFWDRKRGHDVALKIVASSDTRPAESLCREYRVWRQVGNTPGMLRVHGLYDLHSNRGDLLALSLEYAPGGNLADWMNRHRHDQASRVKMSHRVFRELAAVMRLLHRKGFAHLDVKPSNFVLALEGIRICDMGSAVPLRPSGREMDCRGRVPTTPAYRSPELWRGEDPATAGTRADVYSMGCLMAQLVSPDCAPPFGVCDDAMRDGHLFRDPTRPAGVPEDLWRVIARCLEKS